MDFKNIPATDFLMGNPRNDGFPQDQESPQVLVHVDSFLISATAITNQEFIEFVKETNYVTQAEKQGWSSVFIDLLPDDHIKDGVPVQNLPWWLIVKGANWRHPEGDGSTISNKLDSPVIHVSRNDAVQYCKWKNVRLPSEAEWECAARGGINGEEYPWGNELVENGFYHANTWQGGFPGNNDQADGFLGVAPAHSFTPNQYGLYQLIGNVWEWCSNRGHLPLTHFTEISSKTDWTNNKHESTNIFAVRGGSFLCTDDFCARSRTDARNFIGGDSTASNIGFRVVK